LETVKFLLFEGGANPETCGRKENGHFWNPSLYVGCENEDMEGKLNQLLNKAKQQKIKKNKIQ
jgi:hypothetical protein